jgi:hypothetical protein
MLGTALCKVPEDDAYANVRDNALFWDSGNSRLTTCFVDLQLFRDDDIRFVRLAYLSLSYDAAMT